MEDAAFEEGRTNPAQVCATLSPPMGATFSTAFSISIPITFIPVSAGKLTIRYGSLFFHKAGKL